VNSACLAAAHPVDQVGCSIAVRIEHIAFFLTGVRLARLLAAVFVIHRVNVGLGKI
jgi:hypothetical protein